jgi:hypothetical protein
MSQFIKGVISIVLGLLFTACGSAKTLEELVKLERRKTNEMLFVLDSIALRKPDFFYSKLDTRYKDTNRQISFKTSLRMVKDSAINMLITYSRIPILNSIVSKDTLTIVNKKDKCFIREDLSYLKETFGIDFAYNNLEEIFLGLPLDYDLEQKYFQIHDPHQYIISSHRKHKIKRNEKKVREDLAIKYFLNNEFNHLKGLEIISPSDSTEIRVVYKSREMVNGYSIPKEVEMKVLTPRNNIFIELTYEKVEINIRQPLILIIPEGYEKCE